MPRSERNICFVLFSLTRDNGTTFDVTLSVRNLRRRRRRRKESTVKPRGPGPESRGSGRRVGLAGLSHRAELELRGCRARARRLPRRRRLCRDGRNERRRRDKRRTDRFVAEQRLVGVVVERRRVSAVVVARLGVVRRVAAAAGDGADARR